MAQYPERDYYKAGEFAELAGVTVRALHHYDELYLLKPTAHSQTGYRLYANENLARLSQITALRFIGMPLGEIDWSLADKADSKIQKAFAVPDFASDKPIGALSKTRRNGVVEVRIRHRIEQIAPVNRIDAERTGIVG